MLTQAVESYLAVRRAAGFELRSDGSQLQNFARFSNQKKKRFVCAQTAIDWAALAPSLPHRARRLGLVLRLARYLRAEDARHEIPPEGIFGKDSRPRPAPFILSPADIRRLVGAASRLGPEGSLRPYTYSTLFALLACTGLRVSEACRLVFEDITPDGLTIRKTKFRKSCLVSLHETAQAGLERYLVRRRRVAGGDDHVFVSLRGRALQTWRVDAAFRTAVQAIGLPRGTGRRSRITPHSLRHSFVVRALETCPPGRDRITQHMLALSTYIGHSRVADTYWYLEATPHLLQDIVTACETFMKGETS